ncbi:phospholipase C/P1 nuclease domain-containing protein [Mycena amicta]|nr:phospholipase C/P1 nuclease domain-containing protein [Mycena amicta]
MYPKLLCAVSLAGWATTVTAWGAAGHEIAATIAQIHLHPSVLPTMCEILNFTSANPNEPQCHLAPVATWADKLRYKMRWSAALHYVGAVGDHPSQTCDFPGARGWAGKRGVNVLGGIRNVTSILEDVVAVKGKKRSLSAMQYEAANEALKFLIHFMGDMHMPLHLTGRDRGGNSDKVLFNGRETNLHSLWDGLLIAKAIRSVPSKYNRPLPSTKIEWALRGTIYDSYVRMIMVEGVLGNWRSEVAEWLTCPAPPATRRPSSSSASLLLPAPFGPLLEQVIVFCQRFVFGLVTRDAGAETDDELICPYAWAKPIHALNCEIAWPPALDEPPYNQTRLDGATANGPYLELDTPEYSGVIAERRIVEKLLAQAGIRLAGVLNYLFADMGEDGREVHAGLTLDF